VSFQKHSTGNWNKFLRGIFVSSGPHCSEVYV